MRPKKVSQIYPFSASARKMDTRCLLFEGLLRMGPKYLYCPRLRGIVKPDVKDQLYLSVISICVTDQFFFMCVVTVGRYLRLCYMICRRLYSYEWSLFCSLDFFCKLTIKKLTCQKIQYFVFSKLFLIYYSLLLCIDGNV